MVGHRHVAGVLRGRLFAAVLAAALAAGLMLASPGGLARADESAPGLSNSTKDLLTPTLRAAGDGPWTPVLRLAPIRASKGQKLYLQAKLAVRSNVPRGPMIGARIVCLATGGGGGSPYTTRNHAGQSYGTQSVVVRWLFTAPADNTYTCEVRGRAHTSLEPDKAQLRVQSSSYLQVRGMSAQSRQWGDRADDCAGRMAIPGHAACSPATPTARVLDRVIGVFGGGSFTAGADLQLTREYGQYPGGVAEVRTTLQVVQLRADGSACAPPRQSTADSSISSGIHHFKVHHTVADIPVSTAAGCTDRFRVRAYARSVAGNPVLVHDLVYSNAFVLVA